MLNRNLDEIAEGDLQSACADKMLESLTVAFNRELNLDNREQKAQAANEFWPMLAPYCGS
jgi:hypothetical protein